MIEKRYALYVFYVLFVVAGLLSFIPLYRSSLEDFTCNVTDKERVTDADGSKYLVFCEEGTLENTDSLLFWKFDSSDVYGKIKKGKTYTLEVAGWRIPFLSSYNNIITIK